MQKNKTNHYNVLFRDHNGELDSVDIVSDNVKNASDTFKDEYKYCQYTIVSIVESITQCNVYYPNGNDYRM